MARTLPPASTRRSIPESLLHTDRRAVRLDAYAAALLSPDAKTYTVSLPRTRPAVADARHWLAALLTSWGVTDRQIDDAVLALSEIVTNAVEHATGEDPYATVTAALRQNHLRITVSDPDPELGSTAHSDEHGRGLLVVRALSLCHGVYRVAGGKVVWFEQQVTTAYGCPDCGHLPGCGCDCCPYPLPAVAATRLAMAALCTCGCPLAMAGECMCSSLCPCDPCAYCDRDATDSWAGGVR